AENPSLSRLCYRRLWGSRNRRALILGWAYYLDAFSSYPLRTWLPSVYHGHDNWYTRGRSSFSWEYGMGYFSAVAPGFLRFRRIQQQENQERRALPPFPPDSLVLRMLVLRMSDCPSPTLTAQPKSGQLMRSTY
ncbi:hypothetical protein IFM89_035628, partial [Coptis chinensis]